MLESGRVRIWLISILACQPVISHAAPVGLRDLIQAAQSSQIDWQKAETNYFKAKEGVTTERSKLLPDLGLTSTYSYDVQKNIRNQDSVGSSAAITSNWSIWDNGESWRTYQKQLLTLQKAAVDQIAAQDKLTFEILSRYIQHLLARRQREVAERKLKLLQVQFRITERQYRQGLKAVSDFQRLQTEVNRAQLELSRLEDLIQDTFEELQRYIGRKELLVSAEQLEIVKSEDLLDLLLPKVKGRSFDVQQALDVRSATFANQIQKIATKDARAPLWPRIDLSTNAGYGSDSFAGRGQSWRDHDRFFSTSQVQFNWTLFDWGGNASAYRSSILDERLSELGERQAVIDAEASHSKQTRQSTRQEKSLAISRSIFEIERKTYTNIEAEYREGRAQYLDLIKSLDSQAQSEIDLEQNITSYALVLAESLKLTGGLYAALFAK